nr:defensin-like protein P322 [Ipomoea batatas]
MASSLRSFAAALLFVMLFMATESAELGTNTIMAEEPCERPSRKYKGACLTTADCAVVCQTEGFADGKCKGKRIKSKCTCIMRPC